MVKTIVTPRSDKMPRRCENNDKNEFIVASKVIPCSTSEDTKRNGAVHWPDPTFAMELWTVVNKHVWWAGRCHRELRACLCWERRTVMGKMTGAVGVCLWGREGEDDDDFMESRGLGCSLRRSAVELLRQTQNW